MQRDATSSFRLARSIHNFPVVPEEGERYRSGQHRPVTRNELKCDFRNAIFMKHWDSQACQKALFEYELASTIQIYTRYFIKTKDGREHTGWREFLKILAERGIYVMNVGMDPYSGREERQSYHEALLDALGDRYLGLKADSESDGGYTGGWYWGEGPHAVSLGLDFPVPSPNRSRAQAHREFDAVWERIYEEAFHRGVSISSLGYGCHYAAEHGARLLEIEAEESLPSDTLLWSFCRGASKQYEILTAVAISPAFRWGQKCYTREGITFADERMVCGPDYGPSTGLSKREWYTAYMYGASIILFSSSIFPYAYQAGRQSGEYEPFIMPGGLNRPGPGLLEAHLTPIGRLHVEGQEFAEEHPVRGVPYMPVALMLDDDHGWNPPRHLYRQDEDHVWGNIPYDAGDCQIDNFFRWVYPEYERASFDRDERGYITNTPFGDIFEVILASASPACLEKYQAVVLLGGIEVGRRSGLAERLQAFMQAGGTVVVGLEQWEGIPADLSGVAVTGPEVAHAGGTVVSAQNETREEPRPEVQRPRRFAEAPFSYRQVRTLGARVLLSIEDGAPLVTETACGQGRLVLVTVSTWGEHARRHRILKGIRHVLGELWRTLHFLNIEGRPIHYLANVTDRPDEVILTLCNNSPALPWEGIVSFKGEEIEECEAWLGHSETGLRDGALLCGVPANDVRIFRLKAGRPFLPLRFTPIDWPKLGVGIPDTRFRQSPARMPARL